jgi:hypothetical protein
MLGASECGNLLDFNEEVVLADRQQIALNEALTNGRRQSGDLAFPPLAVFRVIEMRKSALLLLLSVLALPALAAGQVTVGQLEQVVTAARGRPDKEVARWLGDMELTQRLSTARFERLKAHLPGEKAQLALLALADSSAFLDLPAADIPATAPPDRATQDALLAKTRDYVEKTISRLPDLYATQETIHFADGPARTSRFADKDSPDTTLHLMDKTSATVRFLAGKEEVVDAGAENGKLASARELLATEGIFGTIFAVVLKDVLGGNPPWSHWEQGSGGPMAVFRYDVPEGKSHYSTWVPGDPGFLRTITAYHGEIALDPADGAILRLTLVAVPRSKSPVAKADIMVEYEPVEIGGKSYICPRRSVALSLARRFNLWQDVYGVSSPWQQGESPLQLQLNDVVFRQYHLFRAESRIVLSDSAEQNGNAPASVPATTPKPTAQKSP